MIFARKTVFLTTIIIGSTLYAQEQEVETVPASQVVIEEEAAFVAPDGTEALVPAGSYDVVEVVQLRLVPVDGSEPVLVTAERTDHEEAIEEPVALWVEDESGPTRHLVLMLPNGSMTDAVASAGGVQTRGVTYLTVNRSRMKSTLTAKLAMRPPQRVSLGGPSEADFEQIGQHLRQYALELRDIGHGMRELAGTEIPEGFNETEKRSLAAQRRELLATADVALRLAMQIERREAKAQRMTLTRVDMESLAVDTDVLARRVNRSVAEAPTRIAMRSTGLNVTIKETESSQEYVRNKRQMAVTAFQNFDQKWNQLFNMLTTVLKNWRDMEAGSTRNML